jgi:Ca-activated chloride channel family protein
VGLWKFSTKLVGNRDYQELVPMGPVDGKLRNGVVRRQALQLAITTQFTPKGATGLYDTLLAAYQYMQTRWQPNRLNVITLMTDGKNEDNGLTKAQLVAKLKSITDPNKPIQVVTVGYGPDADLRELTEITAAVGGKAFPAATGADIDKAILAMLVGSA